MPQKANPSTFTEHEGQQVWSKLDNKLLQEIALKTSGVYIPAGTRAYDLGQLYADHLQGRRGKETEGQKQRATIRTVSAFPCDSLVRLLLAIGV